MYNYRMNYTNAIMRNDWLVNRYLQYHCSSPPNIVPEGAVIKEIRLFIVYDLKEIESAEAGEPYARAFCPRADTMDLHPEDIASLLHPEAGNLTALPILEMQQEFKNVMFDRSVGGNPVSLNGVRFAKGIGTHANGRVTFFVAGADHFSVLAGIDDEVEKSPHTSVILIVEGDDKELYRSPLLTGSSTPQNIKLDITGVTRLSLVTNDAGIGEGSTLNYDDHVSWANPTVWSGK